MFLLMIFSQITGGRAENVGEMLWKIWSVGIWCFKRSIFIAQEVYLLAAFLKYCDDYHKRRESALIKVEISQSRKTLLQVTYLIQN